MIMILSILHWFKCQIFSLRFLGRDSASYRKRHDVRNTRRIWIEKYGEIWIPLHWPLARWLDSVPVPTDPTRPPNTLTLSLMWLCKIHYSQSSHHIHGVSRVLTWLNIRDYGLSRFCHWERAQRAHHKAEGNYWSFSKNPPSQKACSSSTNQPDDWPSPSLVHSLTQIQAICIFKQKHVQFCLFFSESIL